MFVDLGLYCWSEEICFKALGPYGGTLKQMIAWPASFYLHFVPVYLEQAVTKHWSNGNEHWWKKIELVNNFSVLNKTAKIRVAHLVNLQHPSTCLVTKRTLFY